MKKNLLIKLFALIGVIATIMLFKSFTVDESTVKASEPIDVPELIQRNDRIQMGKEWDAVQNDYKKYQSSLTEDPKDHMTRLKLAQLYIKEARVTGEHGHYYPAALSILSKTLEDPTISNDTKFLALMHKAGVQLSLHEFDAALKTGNQAALINPANAQIHGVLVDANVELGNYEKAVALADKMISLKPDIRSYSRVSYLREIHGDMEGAIEAMTMAVKSGYPGTEETAWAMLTLGDIYQKDGQLDNAEKVYQAILESRPDYPFAVAALGDIALAKEDVAKAEKQYLDAIDIIPEVGFYISLASLYQDQGRIEEKEELIAEILVMLKDDTDHGHNMNLEYADLYYDMIGDIDQAKRYIDMEYDKRPSNKDVQSMKEKIYNNK